jgi:hypothetical protein
LHCSNVAVFLDQDAAEDRKAHIRQADLSRQKNQGLSELEVEAKERAQYLLERANAMRMEQEDEVKKLNEVQQENQPSTLSSLLFLFVLSQLQSQHHCNITLFSSYYTHALSRLFHLRVLVCVVYGTLLLWPVDPGCPVPRGEGCPDPREAADPG